MKEERASQARRFVGTGIFPTKSLLQRAMRIESTQQSISPVFQQRSQDGRTKTGVGRKRRLRSCLRHSKVLGSLPVRLDALRRQRILWPRHTDYFLLSALGFITHGCRLSAQRRRRFAESKFRQCERNHHVLPWLIFGLITQTCSVRACCIGSCASW